MNKFVKSMSEFKEKQKQVVYTRRVDEIYFAKQKITSLESFEDFQNLKFLWLNGNKLCHLGSCLQSNILLVELYLHDNNIYSVTGCLQHLKSLQVLLLHNNFLVNLSNVLHEFRNMYCLQILNLFNNPVAFEPNYKVRVISSLPSLKIFDRNEVITLVQKSKWLQNSKNQFLPDSPKAPTILYHLLSNVQQNSHPAKTKEMCKYKKHAFDSAHRTQNNEENKEKKEVKKASNTILIYNSFNWKQMPSPKTRQTMKESFIKAELISHIYQ